MKKAYTVWIGLVILIVVISIIGLIWFFFSSLNSDNHCVSGDKICSEGCTPEQDWDCEPNLECIRDSDCSDSENCTIDYCFESFCVNSPITECINDDGCCTPSCKNQDNDCLTGNECSTNVDCDDDDDCTEDICSETLKTCSHTQIPDCSSADQCQTSNDCHDNNSCTEDVCAGTPKHCSNVLITSCLDNDMCCPTGCTGQDNDCPLLECSIDENCDDQQPCTIDKCTQGYCYHTNITSCANNDGCCPFNCVYADDDDCSCSEDWVCGDWSVCSDGNQERVCIDNNNCNSTVNRPILTRDCYTDSFLLRDTEEIFISNGSGYGIISPQIYRYDDSLYIVYARNDRFPDATYPPGDIDSFIRYYDMKTGEVSDEILVGLGHGDSHGAPTLCIDDRGYIHVFYGCHCDVIEYAVSQNPDDISSFINKTSVIPTTHGYTYPKAVFANGSIYLFFRSRCHGGTSLNQGKYTYIKSDDYGNTWSQPIEFVDPSNGEYAISTYPTMVRYVNGYFHAAWYIKLESGDTADYYGLGSRETRHNAYYAKSKDGITWYNVDETHSSTHITMAEMDEFYLVYNTSNQTKVIGSFVKDYYGPGLDWVRYRTTTAPYLDVSPTGVPYLGFSPTDDGPTVVYWDNGWKRIPGEYSSKIPFIVSDDEVYILGSYVYKFDGEHLFMKRMIFSLGKYVVSSEDTRDLTYSLVHKSGKVYLADAYMNPVFDGGSGTKSDPYRISKIEHLDSVRYSLTSHYILTTDLNFNDDSSYLNSANKAIFTTGEGWHPIGYWENDYLSARYSDFNGTFNGKEHTISNMYTNRPNGDNIGLFSKLTGNVSNLGLAKVSVVGGEHVGSISGNLFGSVSKSYSTGTINSNSTATNQRIGGFIGYVQENGTIDNSWSNVNVTCLTGERIAGFVGQMNLPSSITNSYSYGLITTSDAWSNGGFVGRNLNDWADSTLSCFWNTETSEKTTSQGGIGKTTQEMLDEMTYAGWNEDIWNITNSTYPQLFSAH
ncbi:BNR-4 repeat-containing protein [archaeon]|nr:BNR-4 repeat-containing protein [archaeon]